MEDIVKRLTAPKLPSRKLGDGRASEVDFDAMRAERHEAAAIIEAQRALINRLRDGDLSSEDYPKRA